MGNLSKKYLELIRSFPLRPIHSEADLDRATGVMHKLIDAKNLTAPEQDYMQVLANLIEEYEEKVHPIQDVSVHEMLAGLMEANDVTQTALSKATGIPVSTISELLSQKRDFNVGHIKKLCSYFGLGPAAFIRMGQKVLA